MRILRHLIFLVLVAAMARPAMAAETISLRVGDVYPVGHYMAKALVQVWMDAVKAKLGDQVDLQYFPASQLGKGPDLLSLTQSGVVDIGLIVPAFTPDKLPLSAVAELPGSFSAGCQGTQAFWALATRGGLLDKTEYQPNGIHVLLALVLPPYQMFERGKIDGLSSFSGKKFYSTGGAKDLTVRALGGVPVRMATSELYESLSRGTIDGGIMAYGTALAYKISEFVHSATKGENFGSGVVTYGISVARWNKLPEAVRTVFDAAGEAATRSACRTIDASVGEDMKKLEAAGVSLVAMPQSDRATIDSEMARIGDEWARELDGRGKPGSEVLAAFKAQLSSAK
jgi:TRAP-type C4-dicarboxylate transport system substrate-binding protein